MRTAAGSVCTLSRDRTQDTDFGSGSSYGSWRRFQEPLTPQSPAQCLAHKGPCVHTSQGADALWFLSSPGYLEHPSSAFIPISGTPQSSLDLIHKPESRVGSSRGGTVNLQDNLLEPVPEAPKVQDIHPHSKWQPPLHASILSGLYPDVADVGYSAMKGRGRCHSC